MVAGYKSGVIQSIEWIICSTEAEVEGGFRCANHDHFTVISVAGNISILVYREHPVTVVLIALIGAKICKGKIVPVTCCINY